MISSETAVAGERLEQALQTGHLTTESTLGVEMMGTPMVTGAASQEHPNADLIPAGPCPKCGATITRSRTWNSRGVMLSDRICANQHLSHVKWVA